MTTKRVTLIAVATSLTTVAIVAALLWLAGIAGAGSLASNGGSVPQLINYQGRLTDAAGNPLTSSYDMTFCLYDVATGGTALWTETQAVNVTYGVFNVLLGSVTPIPTSAFNGQNLYLGVRVGSDSEMTPRKRVVSVGYAYRAEDGIPSGVIILWDGATCPTGYVRLAEYDGFFLVGSDTAGTTGGSNTHDHGGATGSHTLTIAEMPGHNHAVYTHAGYLGGSVEGAGGGDYHGVFPGITSSTGGDSGHSHPLAPADSRPAFKTILLCKKE